MSDFVHLHNHSDFSLLDAAQSVEMMCSRVADLGMDSIALTEHGNLFSMIPFYQAAQKKGIKPIIALSKLDECEIGPEEFSKLAELNSKIGIITGTNDIVGSLALASENVLTQYLKENC